LFDFSTTTTTLQRSDLWNAGGLSIKLVDDDDCIGSSLGSAITADGSDAVKDNAYDLIV
jgi:hypothetical protein